MKIGILTHHYINNFGAFLQAYALQEAVKEIFPEDEVYVIDLLNVKHFVINTGGWFRFYRNQESIVSWLQKITLPVKFSFTRRKHLNLTKRCFNAKDVRNLNLDCILVGSDEVWNALDKKSFKPVKFGIGLETEELIAYAPSVGAGCDSVLTGKLKKGLSSFAALSARDRDTEKLLMDIGCKSCTRVLDPTFLVDVQYRETKKLKKPYILFYYCNGMSDDDKDIIIDWARENGYSVYGAGEYDKRYDKLAVNPDPFKWAGLFRDAEYVFTGTFHGTVFSILNNRQFLCYTNNPSRIKKVNSLLEEFELQDRIITDVNDFKGVIERRIDYSAVLKIRESRTEVSKVYLKNSISAVKEEKAAAERDRNCCGCGVCAAACPSKAITMKQDKYGFLYPEKDMKLCNNCGLCDRKCSFTKEKSNTDIQDVYAAANKNEKSIMNSASGGIFTVLAEKVIKDGGVVYGSALTGRAGDIKVKHIRVTSLRELVRLQGSKYVQSDITSCLGDIKNDLIEDKTVLFSGTPCQVDAVKSYVGSVGEKLITCDIICHGVPSHKMFSDYLKSLEKRYNSHISYYKFRDKLRGQGMLQHVKTLEREYVFAAEESSYMWYFLKGDTYRESCYSCPYANDKRVSDITIGDFWGVYIEHCKELSEMPMDNEKGISCVIVNSEKGNSLWDSVADKVYVLKSDFEKVSRHNAQLNMPSAKSQKRDKLLRAYAENGYAAVDDLYKSDANIKRYVYALISVVPKSIKRKIKVLLSKNL